MERLLRLLEKKIEVKLQQPNNGKLEVTYGPENIPVIDGMKLIEGTEVTIKATPNVGYIFEFFEVDGGARRENQIKVVLNENVIIDGLI